MQQNWFLTIIVGLVLVVVVLLLAPSKHSDPSPSDPDFDPSPAAVAKRASESDVVAPDKLPPGYYQPAPSKAVGMTPEWREFADTVDRICGLTYNYMRAEEARMAQRARAQGWSKAHAEAADWAIIAEQGSNILKATARLGAPPAEPVLFQRWRANVALRRDLKLDASAAAGRGDWGAVDSVTTRVNRLKIQSDRLGQRFGLRICTSN